jgi:hypothetical protein
MGGAIILREGFGESEFAFLPRAPEEAKPRLPPRYPAFGSQSRALIWLR